MQEFRPELSDEELEQQKKAMESLFTNRKEEMFSRIDNHGAIFNTPKKLTKSEKKLLKKMRPNSKINYGQLGDIKSVGGVDYQATDRGWQKIGLTKV